MTKEEILNKIRKTAEMRFPFREEDIQSYIVSYVRQEAFVEGAEAMWDLIVNADEQD